MKFILKNLLGSLRRCIGRCKAVRASNLNSFFTVLEIIITNESLIEMPFINFQCFHITFLLQALLTLNAEER